MDTKVVFSFIHLSIWWVVSCIYGFNFQLGLGFIQFFLVEMQIPIGTKHHFAPGPAVSFSFRGPAINVQKSKKEPQQQTERKDHDEF